jgi:UPF0716 family protein affecting phage T7 exclusion
MKNVLQAVAGTSLVVAGIILVIGGFISDD